MSPQLPSLPSGAVAAAVVMEDPVAVVVRCDLTLRKQSLRVRRQRLPSAKVVRVEPGSEAQQVQRDQQQLLLVLVVTRLMEGLGEAAGKAQPVELEVQTVAEETTQPREVGVEADPETVLQTTFCILEPQDQPAPAVQLVALQTTVVVVVVDLAPIPTTL
jgi:hypothetical protein